MAIVSDSVVDLPLPWCNNRVAAARTVPSVDLRLFPFRDLKSFSRKQLWNNHGLPFGFPPRSKQKTSLSPPIKAIEIPAQNWTWFSAFF